MRKLLFIIISLIALSAHAQEQLSLKQQADRLFERYEYFKSLNLYLEITKPNLQVIERVADCYRNINLYRDAEEWYAKAVTYPKASKQSHYYYAEVLLRDGKFDMAKAQYKLYFTDDPAELKLKSAVCDSAALWMKQTPAYQINNNVNLNTAYSDWGLSYDGTTGLIFTSDRITDEQAIDNRTGNGWFKLYESGVKTNEIKQIPLSSAISDGFNGNYHIGPIALNKTGDTAYITLTTEIPKKQLALDKKDWKSNQRLFSRRLQLVIAKKSNNGWLITGSFPFNNIQKYSVSSAALSNNGRLIYFSSDMPGGEGKTDIWYCEKRTDGTWSEPINCGKNINTKEEEGFPFIRPNGTLYFASKGLPGMGGYDIYMAKGEKTNWNIPQNLKYPINTTSDDFCLVTNDGTSGYLSSNREGGKGSDDIYSFAPNTSIVPQKPVVVQTTIPTPKPVTPPGIAGQGFVFEPIYYDLDKSDIRPDAAAALDKLVEFLKQYPGLKIELSSYTDSRAAGDYNMALSKRRAQAAFYYVVAKGIAGNRLSIKWHGKTNLVNNCPDGVPCSEQQHQLNRRTEFKVVK